MSFQATKTAISDCIDGPVKLEIFTAETHEGSGDCQTVARLEDIDEREEYSINQTQIKFVGKEGDVYAHSIYKIFNSNPNIVLLDWVEVTPQLRNNGIGRALLEETIGHLNQSDKQIYVKLENPHLQSTLIDNGLHQLENNPNNNIWYKN